MTIFDSKIFLQTQVFCWLKPSDFPKSTSYSTLPSIDIEYNIAQFSFPRSFTLLIFEILPEYKHRLKFFSKFVFLGLEIRFCSFIILVTRSCCIFDGPRKATSDLENLTIKTDKCLADCAVFPNWVLVTMSLVTALKYLTLIGPNKIFLTHALIKEVRHSRTHNVINNEKNLIQS